MNKNRIEENKALYNLTIYHTFVYQPMIFLGLRKS